MNEIPKMTTKKVAIFMKPLVVTFILCPVTKPLFGFFRSKSLREGFVLNWVKYHTTEIPTINTRNETG